MSDDPDKSKGRPQAGSANGNWKGGISAQKSRYRREYQARNPDIAKAHKAVSYAVRRGNLVRQPCETCSDASTQAHHDDYSKLLEVRWLCRKCHRQWHLENDRAMGNNKSSSAGRTELPTAVTPTVQVRANEPAIEAPVRGPRHRSRGNFAKQANPADLDPEIAALSPLKVDAVTGCHVWTGYPLINFNGKTVFYREYHWVSEGNPPLKFGEHLRRNRRVCRNGLCINPAHSIAYARRAKSLDIQTAALGIEKSTATSAGVPPNWMRWKISVLEPSGCWKWKGRSSQGKAVASVQGHTVQVHRHLWEATGNQPLSKGQRLPRTCRTDLCVNPGHHQLANVTFVARVSPAELETLARQKQLIDLAQLLSTRTADTRRLSANAASPLRMRR